MPVQADHAAIRQATAAGGVCVLCAASASAGGQAEQRASQCSSPAKASPTRHDVPPAGFQSVGHVLIANAMVAERLDRRGLAFRGSCLECARQQGRRRFPHEPGAGFLRRGIFPTWVAARRR